MLDEACLWIGRGVMVVGASMAIAWLLEYACHFVCSRLVLVNDFIAFMRQRAEK